MKTTISKIHPKANTFIIYLQFVTLSKIQAKFPLHIQCELVCSHLVLYLTGSQQDTTFRPPLTVSVRKPSAVVSFSLFGLHRHVRFSCSPEEKLHYSWQWRGDTLRACWGSTSCTMCLTVQMRVKEQESGKQTSPQESHNSPGKGCKINWDQCDIQSCVK